MNDDVVYAVALDPILIIQIWDVDENGDPVSPKIDNEEE